MASVEDGEIEEGGHSSFLPTTTSTHWRNQFKFNRPAKKSPTILILTCLIILSVTLIISLYLGLIPSSQAKHPLHQINWNRPPPRYQQWLNYYGLIRPKIGSKEWKMLYPPSKPAGP
ncbi:hypothetical protein PGTUg99_008591 [Puccinia graminis f. sp. tritici]|uniref:Uncharacterized protein n=1 Tax=Puccinia graminis f. sp. tritici TaxID=56615 RepID=A0A5B0LK51_PUCGR|nr:hypothetical protein PGTUg99_008591 [Puccinia graminis f. sp. tritici]